MLQIPSALVLEYHKQFAEKNANFCRAICWSGQVNGMSSRAPTFVLRSGLGADVSLFALCR